MTSDVIILKKEIKSRSNFIPNKVILMRDVAKRLVFKDAKIVGL